MFRTRASRARRTVAALNAQAMLRLHGPAPSRTAVEEAVHLLQTAAGEAPDAPTRCEMLTKLGPALYRWYEETGAEADLDASVAVYRRLAEEFSGLVDVALVAFNRANALHERALRFDPSALSEAFS